MQRGLVIKSTGSWYYVKEQSGTIVPCKMKGKYRLKGIRATNPVAVGDRVIIQNKEPEDTCVIEKIEDRKNYIIRKSSKLSKQYQLIAANVDQALLMVSMIKPKTLTTFIDRFLVTAEAYHIPAVLIFNKIDRYNEEDLDALREFSGIYEKIGYPCFEVSATEKTGLDIFAEVLKDKVSLLSGHSGVGKSTLINAIDDQLDLKTKSISDSHRMGQHTTTFAEMHPLQIGGYIIDTPGIKGFGLSDFEKAEIAERFPEMRERMADCKFHNCMHVDEPQCAVKDAVELGDIAWSRYESYLKLYFGESDESYRKNIYE